MSARPTKHLSPRAAACALLLGLAGCLAHFPPRLPHAAESPWGTVRAEDPAIASEMATLVDEIAPRIAPEVPGLDVRDLDVRVVRGFADPLWGGATFQMPGGYWMELPVGSLPELARSTLAHELVHYWLGPDWDPLPAVLEEGLADLVAGRVVPEESAIERAGYAILLSTAFSGGLELRVGPPSEARASIATMRLNADLDPAQLPELDDVLRMSSRDLNAVESRENRLFLYGFGYLFASRIGVERLYELCRLARQRGHARIPAEWIYREAGIDPRDPGSWKVAIDGILGIEERAALAEMQPIGNGVYRLGR